MSSKAGVPDAWDDAWEAVADRSEAKVPEPAPAAKLTKAQKRAQHVEQQRQLWDSAENPDRFHWLETKGIVPLKQEFKQQVTLLSRKPNPPVIAKKDDVASGMASLNVEDDDDSETEARKKRESELEERQRKAKIEREEKQRKYAEARERIMGSSTPSSGTNVAGSASRESSHGRDNRRSMKGKMNGRGYSQPSSSADQSPARPSTSDRQMFDPDDMGRGVARRATPVTPKSDQPTRQPRGPESGGRGGFGFGTRGGWTAS